MKKLKAIIIIGIFTLVSGCVSTPEPNPVAVKQLGDKELACEYLAAEYKSNTETATNKIKKNYIGDLKDTAIGWFIWPGLADFNNAPGHEGNALLDRNLWLKNLANVKSCTFSSWPEQPRRYY